MTPTRYSSPLSPNSLFTFSFFPPFTFSFFPFTLSFSPFTSTLLSCCFSPSLPFIIHQFILLFLLWFLLHPSCTTQTHPPVPVYLSSVPTHYTPPHNITVTKLLTVLISFLTYKFPLSFHPHYFVTWSASPTCGNLPCSGTGLQHLTPSSFLSIYYQFYWFLLIVLCSGGLIYLLPALYPAIQSAVPRSAHGIFATL